MTDLPFISVYYSGAGWRAIDVDTGQLYAIDVDTPDDAIEATKAEMPWLQDSDIVVEDDQRVEDERGYNALIAAGLSRHMR